MNEPPDDLSGILGPLPAAPPDPDRRASTFSAATRVLQRGRQWSRALVMSAVVIAFVAGGVSGWVAKPTPLTVVVIDKPAPDHTPPSDPPAAKVEPLTPEQLEIRAELSDDPTEAARLFREAGDRFLTVNRDYENAARCYRRHLAVADADAQKVNAADSWMLYTMKSPVR